MAVARQRGRHLDSRQRRQLRAQRARRVRAGRSAAAQGKARRRGRGLLRGTCPRVAGDPRGAGPRRRSGDSRRVRDGADTAGLDAASVAAHAGLGRARREVRSGPDRACSPTIKGSARSASSLPKLLACRTPRSSWRSRRATGRSASSASSRAAGFSGSTIPLPALLTIQSGINQLRYATLKGIMAAKKKEIRKVAPAAAPAGTAADPSRLRSREGQGDADDFRFAGRGRESARQPPSRRCEGDLMILVVAEQRQGKLNRASWEAIAAAPAGWRADRRRRAGLGSRRRGAGARGRRGGRGPDRRCARARRVHGRRARRRPAGGDRADVADVGVPSAHLSDARFRSRAGRAALQAARHRRRGAALAGRRVRVHAARVSRQVER